MAYRAMIEARKLAEQQLQTLKGVLMDKFKPEDDLRHQIVAIFGRTVMNTTHREEVFLAADTIIELLSENYQLIPLVKEELVDIEVDISEPLLLVSALNAHKQDITLNQYLNNALKAFIEEKDKDLESTPTSIDPDSPYIPGQY